MSREEEFEALVAKDTEREDSLLLPFMRDSRIGQAVLFESVPELGRQVDVGAVVEGVAADHQADVALVREAYERAKNKFERIQYRGY